MSRLGCGGIRRSPYVGSPEIAQESPATLIDYTRLVDADAFLPLASHFFLVGDGISVTDEIAAIIEEEEEERKEEGEEIPGTTMKNEYIDHVYDDIFNGLDLIISIRPPQSDPLWTLLRTVNIDSRYFVHGNKRRAVLRRAHRREEREIYIRKIIGA